MTGRIRAGIGGWTYEPWRGTFFPDKLPHARELEFASRAVTAIEVNGTFYRTQSSATFAKWREETPDDFMFSLKAPRYAVNRRDLREAAESITRFIQSGIAELGPKLGPILWQLAGTKRFDPDEIGAFLALLPPEAAGVNLRHVLEPRHESFVCVDYVALARKHGVATVLADSADYPLIADPTADFVYARLQDAREEIETGYDAKALATWANRFREFAAGRVPDDLAYVAGKPPHPKGGRDCFVFFINGAKVRAPAGAQAFLKLV
jgi:uncharacterized protein YecE (DUF72 family)